MQPGLSGPEDLAPGEGAIMRKGLQPVAAFRDEDVSQTFSVFLVTGQKIHVIEQRILKLCPSLW